MKNDINFVIRILILLTLLIICCLEVIVPLFGSRSFRPSKALEKIELCRYRLHTTHFIKERVHLILARKLMDFTIKWMGRVSLIH